MKRTIKDFSVPSAKRLDGAMRRAAMMLLLCVLTAATAWAQSMELTNEMTELTSGTYTARGLIVDHQLTVNGNVTLELNYVTIKGGIRMTDGSTLTIEGERSNYYSEPDLQIINCPNDEAGIQVHSGCTLIINGGYLDIHGGPGAAAIGGNNDASVGTITINGGKIYADGGGNWTDWGDQETTDYSYAGSGIGCGGQHAVATRNGYGEYQSGPGGGTITINGGEIYTHSIGDNVVKRNDLAAKITINGGKINYLRGVQTWTSIVGNEVILNYSNANNFCLESIDFAGIKTLKLQKNFKIDGTNTVMEAQDITDANFLKADILWGKKLVPCTETIYSVNKGNVTNGSFAVRVGGIDVKKAIAGSTVQVAAWPANGYELTGVTAAGATVSGNAFTMPGQDVTVTPTFTAKATHSISYALNGGTQNSSNPTSYQTATGVAQFYTPTRTNYSFVGWYDNGDLTGSPVTSIPAGTLGDMKLYAKWIQLYINYNLNGGQNDDRNPASYNSAVGIDVLYPATREGYDFEGWYFNNQKVAGIPAGVTEDITLEARWTDHYCTIVFDPDGGSGTMASASVKYGSSYALPANSFTAPTGKYFAGWMVGENKHTLPYTLEDVKADLTVKPDWQWFTFDVAFNLNGKEGTPPDTYQNVVYGNKVTEPAAPTTDGYTFCGWYKEAACTNRWEFTRETVKENATLYAKWMQDVYTVSYNMNGGENTAANPVYYTFESTDIELAAPTKTGYTFTGWTYDGQTTPQLTATIAAHSTGNKVFTANWQINQYTLTFMDGNEVKATITQDYDTDITEPAPLNKKEHIWKRWDPWVPATMPAEDMTINATWHSLTHVPAVEPTCTERGNVEYYQGTFSYGTRYFTEEEDNGKYTYREIFWPQDILIDANGHTWDTPTWLWEKNWYGDMLATIHVECTVCHYIGATNTSEFTTEVTKEPTDTEDGEVTYTATIEIDNDSKFYSDSHTEVIPRTGVVAMIGTTEYPYLKTALDAARSGDVVTLVDDVDDPFTECGGSPSYGNGLVLDLNGRTVTLKSLTMSSDLTVKNGTLNCEIINNDGGAAHTLTLDNATLNCPQPADEWFNSISWMAQNISVTHGSTMTIAGNTFFGYGTDDSFHLSIDKTSCVVLTNAVISNGGYGQDAAVRGQFAQYMPEGYTLNDDDADDIPDGTVMYNGSVYTGSVTLNGKLGNTVFFADNVDNAGSISDACTAGKALDIIIYKRRLYKDGNWNTICLPFDATLTGKLADATLMELDTDTEVGGHKTGFSNGMLYLNFKTAQSIEAGKPYIIKWVCAVNYDGSQDIVNPSFSNVTMASTTPTTVSSEDQRLNFCGTYEETDFSVENKSILFLGAESKLYWPKANASIGAFRAYFHLNGIEAGDLPSSDVKAFVLNFGEEEATEIVSISTESGSQGVAGAWFMLDGRKLEGRPAQHGVYVNNGLKLVIK